MRITSVVVDLWTKCVASSVSKHASDWWRLKNRATWSDRKYPRDIQTFSNCIAFPRPNDLFTRQLHSARETCAVRARWSGLEEDKFIRSIPYVIKDKENYLEAWGFSTDLNEKELIRPFSKNTFQKRHEVKITVTHFANKCIVKNNI